MEFSRRNFLRKFSVVPYFALALHSFLTACETSEQPITVTIGGDCEGGGTAAAVASNHGHNSPVVSSSDVTAGAQQTYAVPAGSAGHTHNFTISPAGFSSLQSNIEITVNTDVDLTGHSHAITISCV